MNQQKQNGNLIAIVAMCFLFAMISFVTNLAAPFGTIWKNQYAGANTLGMMGNMMNFLAYLFMGIPAGNMLVKIGYKKTSLTAMAVQYFRRRNRSIRTGRIFHQDELHHLFAGCFHLRFQCMYAEHGSKPDAEPSGRRR